MKFVSVRDLRGKSGDIWRELPDEGEMIVTSHGRPIAILSTVRETNLEESLAAIRQARAIEAVAALQRLSVAAGTDALADEDIEAEIAAVRQTRKK